MFALFSRILKLAGPYKGRIQGAFACAFVESILSKMPIFLAFVAVSYTHLRAHETDSYERFRKDVSDYRDYTLAW